MNVLKFGGTSVGSIDNIISVRHIIDTPQPKIVVLSAMSGTTNTLVAITEQVSTKNYLEVDRLKNKLSLQYQETITTLFTNKKIKETVVNYVKDVFEEINRLVYQVYFTKRTVDVIISKGELLSTFIFCHFLKQEGLRAALLPALDFMRIDKDNEPDLYYTRENLERIISNDKEAAIYITQGFICRDFEGNISNLKRGGSDYTATIIGAAIEANEVQIWTDIDGFHNNDPRFVKHTQAIAKLSYDEAAELAYFGAKILHPQTVQPLRKNHIPLRLKNTMQPEASGSLITHQAYREGIKAIAAKDAITALRIKSGRMLLAHGFLSKVFEIFDRYETPIDMITTSEIAVSLTIDDASHLKSIEMELNKFAQVTVDVDQTIICMVGNHINQNKNTHQLFQILKDIQVRMISYGGSNNNISILVATKDKKQALSLLQKYVFTKTYVA